jgi:putative PIN family toxin of toxin-antitoxin system
MSRPVLRLVLDTNVWLDWLVFDDPGIARIAAVVAAGEAEIFVDSACEAELARVLGYPFKDRALSVERQAECLARCRSLARAADGVNADAARRLPKCSDPDDQKFLELAASCNAAYLVTKDKALLELSRRKDLSFRIVEPGRLFSGGHLPADPVA